MTIKLNIVCAAVSAGVMLVAGLARAGDIPKVRFGIQYQVDYEAEWMTPLPGARASARGFRDKMIAAGSTKVFEYTAEGAVGTRILEDAFDWNVEKVDIMYFVGHGGTWSRDGASFPSYKNELRAFSKKMKLGDEGRGLSILALQSCAVGSFWAHDGGGDGVSMPHYGAVEWLPTRWASAMRGGLRIVVTSWDEERVKAKHGEYFATNLQAGQPIEEAWRRAAFDSSDGNDPAAFATGTNATDCWNRLSKMTLANYESFDRLSDGEVGYYCSHAWSKRAKNDVCRPVYGCDCAKSSCP